MCQLFIFYLLLTTFDLLCILVYYKPYVLLISGFFFQLSKSQERQSPVAVVNQQVQILYICIEKYIV